VSNGRHLAPRPGFVLDVDRNSPPIVFHHGEGFRLEKLPAVVEWSDLVFVVRRGRVGHLPQMLHLLVERRERIVVCAVRVVAFLFQTGKIVDGEGPIEHATCVIRGRAAIWRSAAPSSGLWADV